MKPRLSSAVMLAWRLARGRGPAHSAQAVFVSIAGLWFLLVLLGAVSVDQARAHQLSRDRGRTPVFAPLASSEQARPDEDHPADPKRFANRAGALYLMRGDIISDRQFPVVLIAPNDLGPAGAAPPVPPGLDRLPRSGEAILSPALADVIASDPDLRGRYHASGLVRPSGLRSPDELIAYVGVEPAALRAVVATGLATSFGVANNTDRFFFSPPSRAKVWAGVALFGIVPALATLVVAARVNSRQRDSQLGALRIIGAPTPTVRLIAAADFAFPFALGAAMAAAIHPIAVIAIADKALFGYSAFTSDLLLAPGLELLLVGVTVVAATVFVVAAADRGSRLGPALRPFLVPDRLSTVALVPTVAGCLAAFWAAVAGGRESEGVLAGALVLVAASLPSALPLLVRRAGLVLANASRGAIGLIAGRHLAYSPRRFARLSAGSAVLAFVGVNAATFYSAGQDTLRGELSDSPASTEVVVVDGVGSMDGFAPDAETLGLVHAAGSDDSPPAELLVGSCRALEALGAPHASCSDHAAAILEVPRPAPMIAAGPTGGSDHRPAGLPVRDDPIVLGPGAPAWLSGVVFVPESLAGAAGIMHELPTSWILVPTGGSNGTRIASEVIARYPTASVRIPGREAATGLAASLRASAWFRAGLLVSAPVTVLGFAMGIIGSMDERSKERAALDIVGVRRLWRVAIDLLEASLPALSAVAISVAAAFFTSWCLVEFAGEGTIAWSAGVAIVVAAWIAALATGLLGVASPAPHQAPEGWASWRRVPVRDPRKGDELGR